MEEPPKTVELNPVVGQTLKHYRVDDVLGSGGMGVVYRAHDLKLQRPVALKLLCCAVTADSERRRRFLLEARAAARISHPSIAQVYDVDEHEGMAFIAMELVEGRTVRELIHDKQLDLLGAIDIAIQMADGLAKAHEMGIVHRDVKPANVILTRDGHVKILDFGLAKLLDPTDSADGAACAAANLSTVTQTQVGVLKGTAAYMSPEQVRGDKVDARSDLFSLGVMLFEMSTGEMPFQGASMVETMHAVAFDETPSIHSHRPNLPVELQRIISRCLRKRPEDRYKDARSLAHDLRVLRRDTESGLTRSLSLKERISDAMDRMAHLRPSQYAWLAGGAAGLGGVTYLLLSGIGVGSFVFLALGIVFIYRFLRNQPQRVSELFVRRVSRIPEVRLIVRQDQRFTVVVDRHISQLYGRINDFLNTCNRKLFFGQPMSVAIQHDLAPEEIRKLLTSPGVQYARDDAPKPS